MANVDNIAYSKITDVIWAQLGQDADLYDAIVEIAKRENIRTGLVLNIVGGLRKARLSTPIKPSAVESQPGILEVEGVMECSGVGFIGHNLDTYDAKNTSGILYEAGEPNVHVHLTINHGHNAHMGHLIEGCKVRSLTKESHFTIVLAKTEGVVLNMRRSKETTEKYPTGVPVHELVVG